MNRRNFLKFNALSLASLGIAYANPMQSHHAHHSVNHTNLNTSFINFAPKNLKLLDPNIFPQGEMLKALPLLQNESKKRNFFRAKIDIEESEIELIKGKKTKFYTYNGSIPAPKIEVFEEDVVEIIVKNKLKEPTTIHWHGVLVPPEQDGNPHDPILAGEERLYRFTIPKDSAGTYWYHPHFISSKQVFMGLAGAFVVKVKKDALSHFKEKDLMISDLRLDENAQISNNHLADWLNGREGEFVLINGQFKPKITLSSIRIYNATAARYLNLRIQGAKFILVGTDGGLIEKPLFKDELFLSPASRAEFLISVPEGGEFKLESLYYDRDKMIVKEEPKEFKEVIMSEDHTQMHGLMKKGEEDLKKALASMFLLNNKIYDLKRIDLSSKVGVVEDWIIINKSHMNHPFHIHGTQFELISSKLNGKIKKAEFKALRDTINVRPNEELRLRMYHCHILEHEDLGMMGNLEVEDNGND
ncbi:multicopper oxidase family protein [Campylobacter felis]|uniref:Multicopper oxidase family protein n=1 Tax=Campylobacter felis TaxID=2974565 RepID=A0ABT7I4I7_9BACT|nr:multicopper oxidase family protein [Campylobacter upsaliensis]MDL0103817.1 multicopper oxidase family protein [Campylobacter felis]MDL0147188.1 multicopper oxidase family protein [Campylobacter felis]